jgi:tetratricopeptide (TPR) repeat protein
MLLRALLFICLCAGYSTFAQSAADRSAQGLLEAGFFHYQSDRYQEAAAALNDFVASYGSSPEAGVYMEKVRRLICFSYLKLNDYDAAEEPIKIYLEAFPDGEAVEELTFWQTVIFFKGGQVAKALEAAEAFVGKYPKNSNVPQIRLMQVIGLVGESKHQEALELIGKVQGVWEGSSQFQALIIALYCELESGNLEAALERIQSFPLNSPELDQISGFHLLCLNLGNRLLEEKEYRMALTALQTAWRKERILSRQQLRLDQLTADLSREQERTRPDPVEVMRLTGLVAKVGKEMETLQAIEAYDTALQFRIAECFFQLDRFREAYLVLSGMLEELPKSELLMHGNYRLLVCLTQMERWEEVIEKAVEFEDRFPQANLLPNVVYLMGEAEMRRKDFQSASAVFARIVNQFPDFAEAERCHFLQGYCLMMTEAHEDALGIFDSFLEKRKKSGFHSEVLYWKAMAFHYLKEWEKSRSAHGDYLESYPEGKYRVDSELRRAHALFGQKNYRQAYKELEAFFDKYPDSIQADEASNLLGDTYFAMGEIDRGIEAYRRTTPRNSRLYDYAWFRIGKALKASEAFDRMEEHFRKFLEVRSDSPRLTEALAQLAWIKRQEGKKDEAADFYWEAIRTHGNDPEAAAVEEMLLTLRKYYRGSEPEAGVAAYESKLGELEKEAQQSGQTTLAARMVWMQSQLAENEAVDAALARLPDEAELTDLSPRLLADAGDALRRQGKAGRAEECYWTILRWYPRSLYKDRSYAGLGILTREAGDDAGALDYFAKFERETVQSPLWSQVLRARADIYLARGESDLAIRELNRILEIDSAKGLPWVQALYEIGSTLLKENEAKQAIPYFQRIYIMYRRWDDYVAKAYWESGQAFEKLQMNNEALNTYKEFIDNTHLSDQPEYAKARERLNQIGGA